MAPCATWECQLPWLPLPFESGGNIIIQDWNSVLILLLLYIYVSSAEPVQVAKSELLTSSVQLVHQPLLPSTADSDSAPVVFSARSGEQQTPQVGQCLAVMHNDVSSSAGNSEGIRNHARCKFVV